MFRERRNFIPLLISIVMLIQLVMWPAISEGETVTADTYGETQTTVTSSTYSAYMPGNGVGVKAEYFNGMDFSSEAFTRIDPQIGFENIKEPQLSDSFSVRWSGKIEAPVTGTVTLEVEAHGKMRFWLGDQLLMDDGGKKKGNVCIRRPQRLLLKQRN